MAITERQAPTTPNQAESDLLFSVTSNNGSRPQFQFVAKIIDERDGNEVLIKQQPMPAGSLPAAKAIFNINQITSDYMGTDKIWKTAKISTNTSANEFSVIFYEETGSSVSSSVSIVNGTSGSSVYLLDGVVEMNSGDWNWPSGSYYTASILLNDDAYRVQHALTNSPLTQSIRDGEYATLSVINGNFDNSDEQAQDIYQVEFAVYDEGGSNIQNLSYYNTVANGGGPRTSGAYFWDDVGVFDSQTIGTKMLHIGVGPENLVDAVATLDSDWAYYRVRVVQQESDGTASQISSYFEKWFTKQTPECDYEGTRFAWLNELGGWDYFTFPYANSKSDSIERKTYQQGFVNYSENSGYLATYDISRRGSRQYSTNYEETRVAESDWLTTEEADWLRELVESPNVYIQSGTDFLPVVMDTANFDYKTNPRSQKMYRLTLSYKLANNRRSR